MTYLLKKDCFAAPIPISFRKIERRVFRMKRLRILRFSVCSILLAALLMPSALSVLAQNECNSLGAPIVQGGAITAADTAQTGRLFRDGRGGTCEFLRTPPAASAGAYNSDSYTYTNTSGGTICVFVDLDATGCGVATNQISVAAYLGSYNPAAPTANLIGDPGLSTGQNFATSMSFSVPAGATYVVVVHNINAGTECASYTFTKYETNNCRDPGFDLANDGSADLALFRPSGGLATWHSLTLGGVANTAQLGSAGDIPVDGDYTGDESSDYAVFRPSNGTWYRSTSPANNYNAVLWGVSGDIPVEGDYDRDGITDVAVYRPSTNRWYVLRSGTSSYSEYPVGIAGDKPVPADYDGDGKMDLATFRPSNGLWTVLGSAGNYGSNVLQTVYGTSTDIPVPADYDGDGKADVAVYRPSQGNWYIFRSSLAAGQSTVVGFGISGDIPQPADYDGDRKADPAVYRPSDSSWWVNRSGGAGIFATIFGASGDIPTTAPNPHLP
jgi:hypothetical protein